MIEQKKPCIKAKPTLENDRLTTNRRSFLKTSAAAVLGLTFSKLPAMAGPFTREDYENLVPADKKLSAAWVKSLFERGEPEVLRGRELQYVGMPVGGIGAGQLYLGGDGQLWHWDIFNGPIHTTWGHHYNQPAQPASPLEQQFALKIGDKTHQLNRQGFANVAFRGEYPIGIVEYADPAVPLTVKMEAFSPFVPLNTDDSSLPATLLDFTVHNGSANPVEAILLGELENGVCFYSRSREGKLRQQVVKEAAVTTVVFSAEDPMSEIAPRPDIVFENWEKGYDNWLVEGTAFGTGPVRKKDLPKYQEDVGGDTENVVNSHASAPGKQMGEKDSATGKLTSREFKIERHYISCWIGGGKTKPDRKIGLTLFVGDKPVKTVSGKDKNAMEVESMDVREFAGQVARLEIVDDAHGGWGHIGVGKITFTDINPGLSPLEAPDFGTMALALLGPPAEEASPDASSPFGTKPKAFLGRKLRLAPGETATVTFVIAWHFPHLTVGRFKNCGRYYATKFPSALAVAQYIAGQFTRLAGQTRLWRDTWYDSSLPYWFLDRTMINTSTLATSTCYRFANGRFYGWEGVGCCAGTCGHVYHYAHAAARLFPDLERDTRERVDFGLALAPDGAIHFRGEYNDIPAIDAQAGTILRALREHQMSVDDAFLKRNWPKIKLAVQWLIAKDADQDGLIESNQHNTLDSDWYGKVAWLSGLYLASLLGAAEMAEIVGDAGFAAQCRTILAGGRKQFVAELFDGEYFINKPDPNRPDAINSGTGCEIDQVFGQSWAFQVGLPRVLPEKETVTTLKSLWRYNFAPDVGPYRNVNKPGRWFAMPGEAGLLMCTFPRKDWDLQKAAGKGKEVFVGYFNECMNGFEHQVAGHMIWEGLTLEGLAVERAVHDRYSAARRNPWNEIECGDHYARSMASYGVYLAACGFEYDGPRGRIGFAPRLTPENFKATFTAAEGWGSYRQQRAAGAQHHFIEMKKGRLPLNSLATELAVNLRLAGVNAKLGGRDVSAKATQSGRRIEVAFAEKLIVSEGVTLEVNLELQA